MNSFVVYMHINSANGKRYVGITSQNPVDRWQNGNGYRKNKHFHDAIRKYGWENFDHIVLASGLSEQEACEEERRLIAHYGTQDKSKGYNLTDGGQFFSHSEESKALMSARRKGKGCYKRTALHIQRLKEHHAGGAEKSPVICTETGKTYASINDASRATGINKKGISGCCRKVEHYNTAGGYHWEFA